MLTKFIEDEFKYDGTQLISLYNYLQHGLLGDSIVAWVGPCEIHFDHMVDGEDLRAAAEIRGDRMLHFIVELFDSTLFAAVGLQRLLAAIVKDALDRPDLRREGDDLYLANGKLSISIATQSPLSSLVHFAVNVTNAGTPVATLALSDLGVDVHVFAARVLAAFSEEVESIRTATRKVRWVK